MNQTPSCRLLCLDKYDNEYDELEVHLVATKDMYGKASMVDARMH